MILTIDSVSKSFAQAEAQIEVLRRLSLEVEAGETVAILGTSGSGKSTFLSLLAGLDRPDSGEITVAGNRYSTMNEKQMTAFRGRAMGIVFQQFHLMSTLTALENVSLPLEISRTKNAEERSRKALAAVGLSHRLNHIPSQLSGGECQRVAIARAIVTEPKILLADEPSGNLDTATGTQVMNQLFELVHSKAITLVLVTHNEELAKRCHRQFRLAEGRFAALDSSTLGVTR